MDFESFVKWGRGDDVVASLHCCVWQSHCCWALGSLSSESMIDLSHPMDMFLRLCFSSENVQLPPGVQNNECHSEVVKKEIHHKTLKEFVNAWHSDIRLSSSGYKIPSLFKLLSSWFDGCQKVLSRLKVFSHQAAADVFSTYRGAVWLNPPFAKPTEAHKQLDFPSTQLYRCSFSVSQDV